MSAHLGDLASLYALGALDERERHEADEHLDGCEACRRLLAQAEADVTAMEAAQEQYEPPAALRQRLAGAIHERPRTRSIAGTWTSVAAAILIALLPAGYLWHQNAEMHAAMTADAAAISRIASTPHRVASFSGMNAQVMYGADGSWYCIVIRGAREGLDVVWPHDGVQTTLGTAEAHGDVALLYLPKSHRMGRLTIVHGNRVLGQAQLVF
jgi:Putative zinc-finger